MTFCTSLTLCMCKGFVLKGGRKWGKGVNAAKSPEEVKRHVVEALKEFSPTKTSRDKS